MTLLGQQKDKPKPAPKHYQQLPPAESGSAPARVSEPRGADASAGELVAQLSEQVSRLVRGELSLAELEAKQRAKKAGFAAGALGTGGAMGFFGACCFAAAAILALAMVLRPWAAALVVGGAFLVVAGMLGAPGLWAAMRAGRGVGKQSVESVKADVEAVREAVRK